MEKKNSNLSFLLIPMSFLLILSISCKKQDNAIATPKQNPEIIFNSVLSYGTITDNDNNVYRTITIGSQTWMAENLKTTKYRNGDQISNVLSNTDWPVQTSGAYCWYNNDSESCKALYGALYNWYSVNDSRNIAPLGWHIPTSDEFTTLMNYLGGDSIAGGKIKETGITHWQTPNTRATNESGFTAMPAGYRYLGDGRFEGLDQGSNFWTSDQPVVTRSEE